MIPAEQVRAALDKILSSEQFANSPRLARFLQFAVEKTLSGAGSELKEYLLGTEVFDRGSDFDPRMDPIVRVEARRLRSKLDDYYERSQVGAIRIVFRKGSYAPAFEENASVAPPSSAQRPRRWGLAAAALAATALASAIVMRDAAAPPPVVAVIPWAEVSERDFADGLGEAVAAELSRNTGVRVVPWTSVLAYRAAHPGAIDQETEKTARDLGAQFSLALPVRRSEDRHRVTALIVRTDRSWKEWAWEYERGITDPFAVQRELARAISDDAARALARIR